jgi:hypothetical protein
LLVGKAMASSSSWPQTRTEVGRRACPTGSPGRDGAALEAGLIFDQAGNLYGTTLAGGFYNFSVVFKLTPNGSGEWNEKVLHQFANGPKAYSAAGLTFDAAGNLYGTTLGFSPTHGSVFEIIP